MAQLHRVAIVLPLLVGACATVCTICIHAMAVGGTVNLIGHERKFGKLGTGLSVDLPIVAMGILLALVAHLAEIAGLGALFIIRGEFANFGIAFSHAAVNYPTLGYGDL